MAIVIFKDVERIIQEDGDQIRLFPNGGFFDSRVQDILTSEMKRLLTNNRRRFSKYKRTSDNFNPPKKFCINNEDWDWYGLWVKMYIPDNFKVKRIL